MGNSKALVTGGCGFVGSNLVDHLKKLNYDVVVIDNLSSGKREYCRNDVEYWHADFQDVLSNGVLDDAGIEVIFHLAAEARIQPSFEDPVYTCKNNSFGTTIVCEFARKNNCRVVYAGSSSFMAVYTLIHTHLRSGKGKRCVECTLRFTESARQL